MDAQFGWFQYDKRVGVNRDPAKRVARRTYAYVYGNPLNMAEPSGLFAIPGTDWCVDIADYSCNSITEQHPELSQGLVDFASGVLDVIPITSTTYALGLSDTSQYANECSGWYRGGQASMITTEVSGPPKGWYWELPSWFPWP